MRNNIAKTSYDGPVYSPFTGQAVWRDDGVNTNDPSILFVHIGDVGEYGYMSNKVKSIMASNLDALAPIDLAEKINSCGQIIIEVNAGWGGVNTYCFAPPEE